MDPHFLAMDRRSHQSTLVLEYRRFRGDVSGTASCARG